MFSTAHNNTMHNTAKETISLFEFCKPNKFHKDLKKTHNDRHVE